MGWIINTRRNCDNETKFARFKHEEEKLNTRLMVIVVRFDSHKEDLSVCLITDHGCFA